MRKYFYSKYSRENKSTNNKHRLAHTRQEGTSAVRIGVIIGIRVVFTIL